MGTRRDDILTENAEAFEYIPSWLGYQLLQQHLPGVAACVTVLGEPRLNVALSHPNVEATDRLAAHHLMAAGSHAKTVTAAAVLRLAERGTVTLNARVGDFVSGLNAAVGGFRVVELLSHVTGLSRDGDREDLFGDAAFPTAGELFELLGDEPIRGERGRFKYSNAGFALLGLVLEAATRLPFAAAVRQEVIEPLGLSDTFGDAAAAGERAADIATGWTGMRPDGTRLPIRASRPMQAFAAACGLVSPAADLCTLMWSVARESGSSALLETSRREMLRSHGTDLDGPTGRHVGLGIIKGTTVGLDWFGHSGCVPGFASRTVHLVRRGFTISVIAPCTDAPVQQWMDGILHILKVLSDAGVASDAAAAAWRGRFWSAAGATDLIPTATGVLVANPGAFRPLAQAERIDVSGPERGVVTRCSGFLRPGEIVSATRGPSQALASLSIGGDVLVSERHGCGQRGAGDAIAINCP
jgi:D-alanyl-D-alanine carboxypeptidase